MKGKFTTYILAFLVIVIWAWVMFNVYDYIDEDGEQNAVLTNKKIESEQAINEKEIYILKLNYLDPFLKKTIKNTEILIGNSSHNNKKQLFVKTENTPLKEVVLPQYLGRISNKKGSFAIILISGKEYMIKEGEQVENVRFGKILNDSIKLIIDKKVYYAKKSK